MATPLRKQLAGGEGEEYLRGISRGDFLLLVLDDVGIIQHHSYVLFDTRTKTLLGEKKETPLFANCMTRAQARGQGLYPRVLRYGLCFLAKQGHGRVVINCDPRNIASINGIKRAGFNWLAETETWILCNRLALQRRCDNAGKSVLRLYVG